MSFLSCPSSHLTSLCSWWKVKVKLDSTDDDGPSGLVPAAYVEPVSPTTFLYFSVVKVLYDYDASSSGELSVKEDEILLVYETDQDWLLVQSQTEGGKAGYVPGNYVEAISEEEEESTPAATTPKAVRLCAPVVVCFMKLTGT
jgi:actin cytoskeleton-regulatory complex protein SLA1